METNEHKAAGDLVRIETFENPYLQGSQSLNEEADNVLKVTMMHKVDGVPVPLDLQLTAGDIVALAGDYYTEAGWGLSLNIPKAENDPEEQTRKIFHDKIANTEYRAFRKAYENLASPNVTKKDVQRIYDIEKSKTPSLLQQLIYTFTVKGYGNKLTNNEAHFSPWSVRAYIVGHNSALRMAKFAYVCRQLAEGKTAAEDEQQIAEKIEKKITKIKENPEKYAFSDHKKYGQAPNLNRKAVLKELAHRYHALAVARDLYAMHFYSDHFAGGHLDRIGILRQEMPEQFGTWGSILINNMHNEDNTFSITVTDPFQPENMGKMNHSGGEAFTMIREDCTSYGDGTYFERGNDENSNMLINGMDNSLGDIARLMNTGERPEPANYGGLAFLPAIDFSKRQHQPLLLRGQNGQVYFRSNVSTVKTLSPTEYKNLLADPENNGYEQLTKLKAFLLVFKLRVLGPITGGLFFSPKIQPLTPEREKEISADEKKYKKKSSTQVLSQLSVTQQPAPEKRQVIQIIPTGGDTANTVKVGGNSYSFHPAPGEKNSVLPPSHRLITPGTPG